MNVAEMNSVLNSLYSVHAINVDTNAVACNEKNKLEHDKKEQTLSIPDVRPKTLPDAVNCQFQIAETNTSANCEQSSLSLSEIKLMGFKIRDVVICIAFLRKRI